MKRFVKVAAFCLFSACLSLPSRPSEAQQPPTLGYAYPGGAAAGSTVEVQLGGYDVTPDTDIFLLDDRIELEVLDGPGPLLYAGPPHWFGPRALNSYKPFPIPREFTVRISIPDDMPAGVIRWQVANANGAAEPAEFVISRDLPEVHEESLPNGENGNVKMLPRLPLILNGRLAKKEEVDRYWFTADQTGLMTCELPVDKIGRPIDAVIEIQNEAGRRIVDAADTAHQGLHLTFKVIQGERYRLTLYDLDYRGDRSMVYRLTMRYGPRVVAMLPTCVPPERETDVTFFGIGIATGEPVLESMEHRVNSGSSSFDFELPTKFGSAGSLRVEVSPVAEDHLADQPLPDRGQAIALPANIGRALSDPRGFDVFKLTAAKGEVWSVDLRSVHRERHPDLMFTVVDASGNVIVSGEDLDGSGRVGGLLTIPEEGEYHLLVADQSSVGGRADAVYRLRIDKPQPEFKLIAPAAVETRIGAEPVKVAAKRRTGQRQLGVLGLDLERTDGFSSEVAIRLESVPSGFQFPDEIKISEKQTGIDIPISCDAGVAASPCFIQVTATATDPQGSAIAKQAELLLTPVMKPRAIVHPMYPDGARTVNRGAVYPAPVVVERLDGFQGPVVLQMAAVPDRVRQGIFGDPVTVPADQTEGIFPLIIPEWVQTDRTSRIILNSVVTEPDASGRVRFLVNRMQRRITMNVEGALLKLSGRSDYFRWTGEPFPLPIEIFRSGDLRGDVTIRLQVSETDGEPLFRAEPVSLAEGEHSAKLIICPARDLIPEGEHEISLCAEAARDGFAVVSQTQVVIAVVDSPAPGTTIAGGK